MKINKSEFIQICNESHTAAQAAQKLNLSFNTFKKYALEYNCFYPNPSRKGVLTGVAIKTENIKTPINKASHESDTIENKLIDASINDESDLLDSSIVITAEDLIEFGIKKRRCEMCMLSTWQKLKINEFVIHYKDKNKDNTDLSNLLVFCPNCADVYKNKLIL